MTFFDNLASAGGYAGSNYTFLTLKERDIETGLDYFGARYYGSPQGRFTGADPYDISYERQETRAKDKDTEKADEQFTEYIGQPQHWNHYSYALNNPLKYVDPDGLLEYETKLFGKTITIEISDKIDKKTQAAIKKEIDSSIAKLSPTFFARTTLRQGRWRIWSWRWRRQVTHHESGCCIATRRDRCDASRFRVRP